MTSAINVRVWDLESAKNLAERQRRIILLPDGAAFLEGKDFAYLYFFRGEESLRVGRVKIIRQMHLSLSCITPDLWAMHIGPRPAERYILSVREFYGFRDFSMSTGIDLLDVVIVSLDRGYREIVSAPN
jgi:hypothetical protein